MKTVLILDAEQRVALAVARSLGSHGCRVVTASSLRRPLAGASRWVDKETRLPDPADGVRAFVAALEDTAAGESIDVVLPLTDASLTAIGPLRTIGPAVVAAPDPGAYAAVSDKHALWELAGSLGVPVPRSVAVRSTEEYRAALDEWSGPVVIKPALSRYVKDDRIRSTAVRVAASAEEALAIANDLFWLESMPGLLQEFVPGGGAGVFTVYGDGGPVTWFAHRRIREKPPGGGVSVVSESAPVDPELNRQAAELLGSVRWTGPAMVEFRVRPDGRAFLMEINGRFWGSLQLAIDAGLDLPRYWIDIVTDEASPTVEAYTSGRRLRWLLGDTDSLYLTLKDRELPLSSKLRSILAYFNFFTPRTRLEVLRLNDPKPFVRELRAWFGAFRR